MNIYTGIFETVSLWESIDNIQNYALWFAEQMLDSFQGMEAFHRARMLGVIMADPEPSSCKKGVAY